ncbi:host specificity factor TipJ family phage tail protein [Thalassospira sp. TSL5-1]|uniref:host specificity factor TipJ family phage tail protein n=1 Tax=Thalassospira sp. TSL5-1 TaxID=1544451 RepID=UPI0009F9BA61|nr:host specificity factor TipJ family phage tail protein [Thalassospira sp. TSL5-1]
MQLQTNEGLQTGIVVRVHNFIEPSQGREVFCLDRPVTIRQWLDNQGISEFPVPTVCIHNDQPVLRDAWATTVIKPGDICQFWALPHGGGGGGGGSNPLQIVLTVAIMVAAVYTGGLAAGALGFAQGTAGYMAVSAAVGLAVTAAGTALVNAIIPPPKPSVASYSSGSYQAPSPTYSLQGQANSARLGSVIPAQYGRHKRFPDMIISTAWSEYVENDQYIHMPLCLGLGRYDVEKIKIADTDISNFDEITHEIVEPGENITLFDINVITRDEVSGQELPGTNEVESEAWCGPFVLNPVDSVANQVGIDVVFDRGLYFANDNGSFASRTVTWDVQCRAINEDDEPDGDWVVLGQETKTAATNDVLRISYKYALPSPGRYEVRLRRTNAKDLSSRAGNSILWAGLKAFVDGPDHFDDVSLLMVRMKATNNLSQRTSRQINVIQTRKLPVWSPTTGWSDEQPTRSIVWAMCDIARADYGAQLPDSRLILEKLAALDAQLEARGDHFDGVFDSKTTVWDALTRTARCGRAVPFLQGGILQIVRDTPQNLPVAMFGPRNIIKGSFSLKYVMPSDDTADAVKAEFFNERTWKPATVIGKLPDSTGDKPATVSLFGITGRAHALREAEAMAADNRYRRVIVTFRTELDGMIPSRGDLLAVTHNMPRWGQGGEIEEWDPVTGTLTLSEPVTFEDGLTHYIALRDRDGSFAGSWQALPGPNPKQIVVSDDLGFTPYTGSEMERTYFSFGPGDTWAKFCLMRTARPRNGGSQIEITAVVDDVRAHVN